MNMRTRIIALTLGGWIALGSSAHAQTQSTTSGRATVAWTIGGAGAGFGVGLWAGLSAFDDAINSDRKVWTSAVVGAAVGAVGGYLIGKSHARGSRPSTAPSFARATNGGARVSDGCDRVLPRVRSLSELRMFRAPLVDLDPARSDEATRWYSDGIHLSRFRCSPEGP